MSSLFEDGVSSSVTHALFTAALVAGRLTRSLQAAALRRASGDPNCTQDAVSWLRAAESDDAHALDVVGRFLLECGGPTAQAGADLLMRRSAQLRQSRPIALRGIVDAMLPPARRSLKS